MPRSGFKLDFQYGYTLLFSLLLGGMTASAQTVLLDDFNRANNNTVGNGWNETETVAGTGATISGNNLRLASTTSGKDYVWRDVSTYYNTVLNTNTGTLTWAFNLRQSRTDPSGFDAGNYGIAFVLGASSSNFLSGSSGYAVVLGNSGSGDNLRLVRFASGMNTSAALTNVISPAIDYANQYMAVRVTYNPVGNAWTLEADTTNAGVFEDPVSGATYVSLGSASDATYTGVDLMYLGCLWNHNTAAGDAGLFDNIYVPSACSPSPEPTTQATNVTFTSIGAGAMTVNWTRGNGTFVIVIGRQGGAVTSTPTDGASYSASSTWGSGTLMAANEYVVYSGSGTSVNVTGLNASTSYSFSVFEFNGTGCTTNYLLTTPATGTQSTASCVLAAEPTVGASGVNTSHLLSNSVQLNWTRGNGTYCIVVCRALSAVTTPPIDGQSYTANAAYGLGSTTAPGEYIVYQGTGTSVVVTGIIPNTTYYFAVFEMNGSGCNSNYYVPAVLASANATTPAIGTYNWYYGNMHAHSDYSDGDMDNTCNGAGSATCCYSIGQTALNFNFMGISDHNHNEGPVMTPAKYASGLSEATAYTAANPTFIAFYGMEFGTISTGGHVTIYGINQLLGWNTGNYNVYVAKGDYNTVFNMVASTPGAFTTLCHPNNTDFGNILGSAYNATYDNAIVGCAVKNGPFSSTNITYSDPAPGNTVSFFNQMLAKGYHLGPTVDQDNHNSSTMGKSNQGRTVVLATALDKTSVNDAMLNMRFYATEDYNIRVTYTVNGNLPMGTIITQTINPTFNVNVTDPDGESVSQIRLMYGVPGSGSNPTALTTVSSASSLTYTHSFGTGTYYYYAEITQPDGNVTWTSPIWYTKIPQPLPIELLSFTGKVTDPGNRLEWVTATETNNDYFSLERSRDGLEFSTIARVDGAGNSSQTLQYQYLDTEAGDGLWYYRLRQNDFDGNFSYSDPVALRRGKLKDRFSVYPNPTAGRFTIGLTTNTYAEYEVNVFDALGEVVFSSFETARAAKEISLEHLPAGVYTLLLRCDGEQAAFKLVIER